MLHKLGGRIGAVLFERFQVTEPAIFVKEGVLEVPTGFLGFLRRCANQTALRNEFDVNLDALAGVLHLLIGFGHILWIWQLYCHLTTFLQETVQTRDASRIAPLSQLHPEHHQPCVGIAAAHIFNEFDFLWGVLVGVMMRAVRAILQRMQRPVVAFEPAVDILSVCMVADSCFCYPLLLCVTN